MDFYKNENRQNRFYGLSSEASIAPELVRAWPSECRFGHSRGDGWPTYSEQALKSKRKLSSLPLVFYNLHIIICRSLLPLLYLKITLLYLSHIEGHDRVHLRMTEIAKIFRIKKTKGHKNMIATNPNLKSNITTSSNATSNDTALATDTAVKPKKSKWEKIVTRLDIVGIIATILYYNNVVNNLGSDLFINGSFDYFHFVNTLAANTGILGIALLTFSLVTFVAIVVIAINKNNKGQVGTLKTTLWVLWTAIWILGDSLLLIMVLFP